MIIMSLSKPLVIPSVFIKYLAIYLCCFISPFGLSDPNIYRNDLPDAFDDSGWEIMVDKNGMQIFTREWPGSDFVALKGVQTINSSLSNILGNFTDIASFPEWVQDAQEGYVIEPFNSQRSREIYLRMSLPWPLDDREIVSGQQLHQDPKTKIITITEWYEGDTIPITEDVVRVPRLNTEFLFIPVGKNLTKLIWQGHNDPGGNIPSFIVNWMIEDVFFTSMMTLKKRFESPEYLKSVDWVLDFED